jgi:hypothetical protein
MKAQFVIDLLKSNANRFTPEQLETATGSPRRARRALFLARKEGVKLEAIRDSGRAVTAYVCTDTALPTIAAKPAKAAKAVSAKAAAKAKTIPAKTISKEVAAVVAKNKAPSKKADEAVKAKNLATIKAVHAKVKQNVHPVTKRPISDEQQAILDEFAAQEAAAEAELEAELAREEREAARASVREYLKKEVYAE